MITDETVVRLWPGAAPGALGDGPSDVPTLTLFTPRAKASGAAMLICPGGAYCGLSPHEAEPMARWLSGAGVFCAVLSYRLGPRYRHPCMFQDVTRAMRTLRANAAAWGIGHRRIGVMGASAGGHLAATLSTTFDKGNPESADPVERVASRPDATILLYPVITLLDPLANVSSRQNLLGRDAPLDLVKSLEVQWRVNGNTPPAFLFHTTDDAGVAMENSILYTMALRRAGVSVELHLYRSGVHGVGLAQDDPILRTWPRLCENWLRGMGWLSPQADDAMTSTR